MDCIYAINLHRELSCIFIVRNCFSVQVFNVILNRIIYDLYLSFKPAQTPDLLIDRAELLPVHVLNVMLLKKPAQPANNARQGVNN